MRKLFVSVIVSFILLFNVTVVNAAGFSANAVFNTARLDSGIIGIAYNADTDKKLKVLVEKEGKKISYDLKNDGTVESFPLQFGNGEYKVSVMENLDGTKYKYVTTKEVSLSLDDQNDVFLASIQNVNWNEDMAAIKKAYEITKGLKTEEEKIKAIYTYIISNIKYDFEKLSKLGNSYVPDIDDTLSTKDGICYDFASVLAAMLRSQGIPTKLVKGYAKNVNGYHAWNEVYNTKTGNWDIIDATYDSQMKEARAKYTMDKDSDEYTKVNEY